MGFDTGSIEYSVALLVYHRNQLLDRIPEFTDLTRVYAQENCRSCSPDYSTGTVEDTKFGTFDINLNQIRCEPVAFAKAI